MGLHFPPERWADLERGLTGAAKEFGLADVATGVEWLLSATLTKAQLEVLASHLTVGETYFFREKKTFEVLAESILPELIRARRASDRRLRIWSAACCTGEEPYSLAILLQQVIPDLAEWNVTILATDINERFLRKASAGVYGEWSFRESPAWFKDRYFRRTADGHYAILPEIKKRVTFAHLNLAADAFPSLATDTNAMDLIFCRNVLMYFTLPQMRKVVGNLHRALVPDGWLVVSPSECSQIHFSRFAAVNFPGVILYQKSPVKERVVPPWTPPQPLGETVEPFTPVFESPPSWIVPPASPPPEEETAPAEIPPTAHTIASSLYEQGRYAEAAETLRASLTSSTAPASEAASLLARALANQGKLGDALAWCERWLVADKLDASGHYLRAMILQELGDSTQSRRSLQRAIYLNQEFILGHFALGNLARDSDMPEEADKHFTNALQLLHRCEPGDILPESEGLTAARLTEIIHSIATLP
ncbi:MAG: CheR family methyltransferase [Chthoniobacter sp.]|nr:CheR family methyltransferase [Chthoniobacter sp.]